MGNIDWKSLEFTCVKEKNPPFDKESDHWFKSARAIEKGERPGTDAQMVELYEMAVAKITSKPSSIWQAYTVTAMGWNPTRAALWNCSKKA